jgi:hypothetical protein
MPRPTFLQRSIFQTNSVEWWVDAGQGIWNLIFTLSNIALFLFLPFAYLLCESEGFIGAKVRYASKAVAKEDVEIEYQAGGASLLKQAKDIIFARCAECVCKTVFPTFFPRTK